MTKRETLLGCLVVGGVLVFGASVAGKPPVAAPKPASAPADPPRKASVVEDELGGAIEVPPPPFSDGVFPCTDCHAKGGEVDRTRRELSQHDEIKFEHDTKNRWCLDCHSADDRDKLHLASGELVEFTESYRLCGQCHGDKYRDWRAGVHGRRVGYWNGKKKYLLCVHCHSPHSPRFRPVKPEPPPVHPEHLR